MTAGRHSSFETLHEGSLLKKPCYLMRYEITQFHAMTWVSLGYLELGLGLQYSKDVKQEPSRKRSANTSAKP